MEGTMKFLILILPLFLITPPAVASVWWQSGGHAAPVTTIRQHRHEKSGRTLPVPNTVENMVKKSTLPAWLRIILVEPDVKPVRR